MVIEIPRWLDDAIDGQMWTLIGLAALAAFWAATVAWYVASAAARGATARYRRCPQPAPGPARHPATGAR